MSQIEYLSLFSNQGSITVNVKFKDFDGKVTNQSMKPNEIIRILSPETGEFVTLMSFDEWPFEVYKYEIDPIKNLLTIHARRVKSPPALPGVI